MKIDDERFLAYMIERLDVELAPTARTAMSPYWNENATYRMCSCGCAYRGWVAAVRYWLGCR